MEYEYKIERVSIKDDVGDGIKLVETLINALDAYGAQGWRFSGYLPHSDTKDYVYLIYERPIR